MNERIKPTKQQKIETAEDYLRAFEAIKDEILEPGEIAKQMADYHPRYFITNQARVFSMRKTGKVKILKPCHRDKVNFRNCIDLSVSGKEIVKYIHSLVAQYFSVKKYLTSKGKEEVHHIKTYDEDKPKESNIPENLEIIDSRSLHKFMHCLPFTTESEKQFLKTAQKLSKLANPNYDTSVIEISADENERSITAMTYGELLEYLKSGEIMIQYIAYEPIEEEKDGDALDA